MKIAITSTGEGLKDDHDPRFGRCSYFLFYDTEQGLLKAVENKGVLSGGGAGIAASQQIIDEGAQVVLTGNMGPNAYQLMKSSGIKVYRCRSGSCRQAVDDFKQNLLTEITEAGPSHVGMNPGK